MTYLLGFWSPNIASESRPGQFVMIRITDTLNPFLRRPFSICGVQEKNLVCILYRVIGTGTMLMTNLKKGDEISVLGPLGNGFILPENDQKPLLVAGGIGLAPLFYLTQSLAEKQFEFMAGFATAEEVIGAEHIGVSHLNIVLSTDDGSAGYEGVVTDLLATYLKSNVQDNNTHSIYACGPIPMLKKVASMAADSNIGCQVSLESVMACGLGACQGCAIKSMSGEDNPYYHICKDGPVFQSNIIDWSIL